MSWGVFFFFLKFTFHKCIVFPPGFALCWSLVHWDLWELNPQGLYPHHREQPALHLHRGNKLTELMSVEFSQHPNSQILSKSLSLGYVPLSSVTRQTTAKNVPVTLNYFCTQNKKNESLNAAIAQALLVQIPVTFPFQPGPHAELPSALSSALRTSSSSAVPMRRPYIMKLVTPSWIESCAHTGPVPATF